jgi:hypothetical protein
MPKKMSVVTAEQLTKQAEHSEGLLSRHFALNWPQEMRMSNRVSECEASYDMKKHIQVREAPFPFQFLVSSQAAILKSITAFYLERVKGAECGDIIYS